MEDLWTIFCGESGCTDTGGKPCDSNFEFLSHPSSCIIHILIISFDILLLIMLIFNMIRKSSSKTVHIRARFLGFSNLQIVSAIVNGCLGFVYLCLGIWNLEEKLRKTKTALPLNWWLLVLVQGFTWLLISLTVSLKGNKLPRSPLRLLTILSFLFAGIVCALSLFSAIFSKEVSIKVALDMLSFPGAILLMFCTFKGYKYQASDEGVDESSLYTPLNGEASDVSKSDSVGPVTLFAKAGFFSGISFWWLNPLMKRGRERTLEDEDIPKLREADRAESCYLLFLEQLNKQKQAEPASHPSILRTIIVCHWKEILNSGFFALLKILTLSAGPVLLNAFILVAEGKESFKYEGYVLAMTLFVSKCIESVSQRQWYFRSRLIGLKVRSLLTAAIYKKQLRLSNAAKLTHSGGEIMNYVTVDAYRIGEFPFWFHQTWTTSLQLCIVLVILCRAVGLATFAALVVLVLTVLCNAPLAKLQHKFQSKLMVAQDERLRASSEALINMKVLKLYAWETHFKTVIENLRKVEYKWLSAVQSQKAYNSFLFWTAPVLVSAATFGACYFLKIPLRANNVFTFVATLRLVQDPVRSIPDVIGVVIQAKVAFERILKFLEAPELQSANVQRKTTVESVNDAISIKSANFAWEENLSKPTLRDINLEVRPGEKVAICGEVGSGKSTLLAAILGEVPNIQGTIQVYGKIAYVSQSAWIQTGTIQENILFGSNMDSQKYRETLERCSLVKDLELLPYGDLTEIGERGVNLSGGQKQRIQLARALYQDADIYLLDDPFSAVDAHTATSLFSGYYFSTAKELMRINGTTKSLVANHLVESIAGAMTIRAFEEEERFFAKNLVLVDTNASPFFHTFSANEWLIQRLEILSATVLASAALCMVLLPPGTFGSGIIGMALSYGLSLNMSLVLSIQNQCTLANYIISVERLDQYMHIPSEAPEIIEGNRPPTNWPSLGKVEILDLQIRYRPDAPLVLRGISCTFEGGQKIGIVGRTGSGKSTLIGALFRLVEPVGGKIVVDGIDICMIGLHDLRSRFGIIPQDPTLFAGTVRFNLDPLSQHSDKEIWEGLKSKETRIMEDLWTIFCGESGCADNSGKPCSSNFEFLSHPSSCINHILIICFDILLLVMFIFNMIRKSSSKTVHIRAQFLGFSNLQIVSAIVNGCLGFVYLCLGIWNLEEKLRKTNSALPLNWWLLVLVQGFTWLLISLTVSLKGNKLPRSPLRLLTILSFLFAGIVCALSLFSAILSKEVSIKVALDMLSFPGAVLLMFCTFKGYKYQASDEGVDESSLYTPLNGEASVVSKSDSVGPVTLFAKAGFFSRISFWWLNPLMKRGRERTLEDEDIPKLREADRAESCYLLFLEQLNKQKQAEPSSQPSILRTIIVCHWKEILKSGFFALLKILTLSAGPVLLNAFILVAEGKESFKYEGYVLAITLFISKCIESVSQRQWYFRSRLIGLKVRSLLTAAIYKKQLRLSNAAKLTHSGGEIMNYVTVDAYRIGEFPFWFHQTWTTSLQLCIALVILYRAVGLATFAALVVVVLTVLCNAPLAKLQHKFQSKLMVAQDERLRASSEALINMKVLKLYAWETHFKTVIENLRKVEYKWLSAVQSQKAYNSFLYWTSPVLVSAATFGACYFLKIPLHANNVFTFVATLCLVQDPVRSIPDVIGVVIQAKVAFERILKFLEAPELQSANVRRKTTVESVNVAISIKSANFAWEENLSKPTLRDINLEVRPGEKVAICGEVGSGKSTLLAAILGEVLNIQGTIQVYGKIAYVSQSAWIQTGTIQENVLFGSNMDSQKYRETLERCSLVKDLELLPYGDLTEIGERGVNLSGGQKQRIQLARALYQDADMYLLDDPFSAVDAHTATSLFSEYIMEALSGKTVLLVTHQVDFLPAFHSILLMSDGEILQTAPYHHLLASSIEFRDLVNAHKKTAGSNRPADATAAQGGGKFARDIRKTYVEKHKKGSKGDQLIKQEEREIGDMGYKPYLKYLNQNKGFLYFSIASLSLLMFLASQISQNSWMAANVENPNVSTLRLIVVYLLIAFSATLVLLSRSLASVALGLQSSKSLFSQLLNSLFRAPMSFYDSTPLGRILSRVSSDLSIVDLDVPFSFIYAVVATTYAYANLGVLAVVTWQVLFVSIPMVYLAIRLQGYYFSTAKELMRINGTTKSLVANHLTESVAGAMTIRAFEEEERFFAKNLVLVDTNASPFFHSFSANEWLIQRLEILSATVLVSAALCMVLLSPGTFGSGFIGMALSYGLSLNMSLVFSIQNQCTLANYIISVERLDQYMHIPSEAPEIIKGNRPPTNWPSLGKVEILDLQIRYRPDAPLVLRGISCTFEGGQKVGIVGRTGSGKSTLIGALFRLVEPVGGKIVVDGIDICMIGLHDLRSHFGIIPQDPTLFAGTVRFNLDPLSQHSDKEIWEVLEKCQLQEVVEEKEQGLDSLVVEDGSNWSQGQRQLFCLGRALLRRSRILVLDEATASIDNATDTILQKTIRTEFADCTVITVAHRIPTVMDCGMVLGISEGKLVEYDEPMKLMKREGSLFGQLVKEYWSHLQSAESL